MIIKQEIEWHTEEISYEEFEDGQEVIFWTSEYNFSYYRWKKEETRFYEICVNKTSEINPYIFLVPEACKNYVKAWAYFHPLVMKEENK
jgi:hypothetical protein